ncbi:MAG: AtpZ/AtpI family protein [Flavobacteriaceae bacterium]|nr:AtpZ/AtpI family protein [Flavobacteriaceae bacterium]
MNSNNKSQEQKPKERLNTYARFSGIGFQMIAIIGLGVFLGIKLDEKYPNKYSLFAIICSLTSIGIALYFVIKQVTRFSNKDNSNEQKNK